MLSLTGNAQRYCDGVSRRSFLSIGALAAGGLTLPQLLRAESESRRGRSHKAVIMVFLSGGPPHQDMFDLKPDAPVEIRGEFKPIASRVPGLDVCELFPRIASMADRLAVIRSVVGSEGRHAAFQCMTGRTVDRQPPGGWPSFGSCVSKLQGQAMPGTPPFVGLSPKMRTTTWADPGQSGFAGQAHSPFTPYSGNADLELQSISLEKLKDRQALRHQFDRMQRIAEVNGTLEGFDAYHQQAFGILTSSKVVDALDLEQEDPAVRERYGRGANVPAGYGDAGPIMNDYFLAARRLVEAGVRVVTLAYGRWDWHGRPHGTNFENARDHFPQLDQGLTALLEDLRERGLDRDVTVLVWGEFGRTPRINKNGGRDHWPQVGCALMAGGGLRTGQVIGSTNRLGEHAQERPVHFQEIFATLYHQLGIDTNFATIKDWSGRPQYLVDHTQYQALRELV